MMTAKELKKNLEAYPDDANIITRMFLATGAVELVVVDKEKVLGAIPMSKEEELDATINRTIFHERQSKDCRPEFLDSHPQEGVE